MAGSAFRQRGSQHRIGWQSSCGRSGLRQERWQLGARWKRGHHQQSRWWLARPRHWRMRVVLWKHDCWQASLQRSLPLGMQRWRWLPNLESLLLQCLPLGSNDVMVRAVCSLLELERSLRNLGQLQTHWLCAEPGWPRMWALRYPYWESIDRWAVDCELLCWQKSGCAVGVVNVSCAGSLASWYSHTRADVRLPRTQSIPLQHHWENTMSRNSNNINTLLRSIGF